MGGMLLCMRLAAEREGREWVGVVPEIGGGDAGRRHEMEGDNGARWEMI